MFDQPVFQSVHDPADPLKPPHGGRNRGCLSNRIIIWSLIGVASLGLCFVSIAIVQAVSAKPSDTPTPAATITLPAPVVKGNNESLVGTSVAQTLQAIQPGAPSATPSATNALLFGEGTKLSPQTVLTVIFANQSPSPARTPTNTAQPQPQSQAPIVLIATNTKAPIIVTATLTATDKVVVITTTPGPTQTPYIIVQSPTPAATAQ